MPSSTGSSYTHLIAIDAATGKERWRYPSAPIPGNNIGVCLEQPLISGNTIFGTVSTTLHAVDLTTGKDRFAPVEVRRPVEGRERAVEVGGLVDAGPVLVGLTSGYLIAFDKATGKTAWEVKGQVPHHCSGHGSCRQGPLLPGASGRGAGPGRP